MAVSDAPIIPGTSAGSLVLARDLGMGDLRMRAYQHVNLDLERGKAHAICGEDGSGKTELLLTLAGRMRPTHGSCLIDGNDVHTLAGMHAVRKMSALGFFDNVNDVERVLRVRTIASAELGLAGKRSNHAATEAFLGDWGLLDQADSTIEDLPRPDYDYLGIALAMAHEPRLLLVDDIERDMTGFESRSLCSRLCRLAESGGITVVCGVLDYDLAACFDSVVCISEDARAQQTAWQRKHLKREAA